MTAIIASIAPEAAWLSSDSLGVCNGRPIEYGPKLWALRGGWAVAGAARNATVLELFAAWLNDCLGRQRPGVDLAEQSARWLRNTGERATVLLVRAGGGWAFTFEDGYEPHALEVGCHTCRPGFADLPGFTPGDPSDVPAFHFAYLRAAAAGYRDGLVTFEGLRSPIGGTAWCCHVTADGAELVNLGPIQ